MATRTRPAHRRRVAGVLGAGLASAALLVGCGAGGGSGTAAGSSGATSSSAAQTSAADLASGLLPAAAFGPDAAVTAISPKQLQKGAGIAASAAGDLQITPEGCAAAVKGTQPPLDAFDDIAAQSATAGATATVEVLVRGGPIRDSVAQLAEAAQRCPQAQISSSQIGQATVTFQDLPVDGLGDRATALQYTTTATAPDGTQVTVPSLIGGVQDGDRLVILIALQAKPGDPGAAVDPATFTALLRQAYQVQADALG
jgi:hypothetical protein